MEKGDLVRLTNQDGWSNINSWSKALPVGTILRVRSPDLYGDVELEPLVPESGSHWPNGYRENPVVTLSKRNVETL